VSAGDDLLPLVYEGFNSGDMAAALELLDEDFEFREPAAFPGALVYKGRDGFVKALRNAMSVFDEVDVVVEKVLEAGSQVVVFVHISGVGKESGAPVEMRVAHVWTMYNCKAIRMQVYLDRGEALAAVGLHEQA
jgi:uncharacterized protein